MLRLPYTAFSKTCISAKRLLVSMEKYLKPLIDDCGGPYFPEGRLCLTKAIGRLHAHV